MLLAFSLAFQKLSKNKMSGKKVGAFFMVTLMIFTLN